MIQGDDVETQAEAIAKIVLACAFSVILIGIGVLILVTAYRTWKDK